MSNYPASDPAELAIKQLLRKLQIAERALHEFAAFTDVEADKWRKAHKGSYAAFDNPEVVEAARKALRGMSIVPYETPSA